MRLTCPQHNKSAVRTLAEDTRTHNPPYATCGALSSAVSARCSGRPNRPSQQHQTHEAAAQDRVCPAFGLASLSASFQPERAVSSRNDSRCAQHKTMTAYYMQQQMQSTVCAKQARLAHPRFQCTPPLRLSCTQAFGDERPYSKPLLCRSSSSSGQPTPPPSSQPRGRERRPCTPAVPQSTLSQHRDALLTFGPAGVLRP